MFLLKLYLQLLKLSYVGVTLQLQVSHLVFMFLLLVEPLVLLPLLFLSCKLENQEQMASLVTFFSIHRS